MQESPEYADYVSFNHCTFANTMMFSLESSYWWWLSITNSVFVNIFMFGDTPSQDGTNQIPNGGLINIDSTSGFSALAPPIPFTDSSTATKSRQRHILLSNNSYGFETWYTDFLAHNAVNDTAQAVNKIYVMPLMSGKTYRNFFGSDPGGAKRFPYINMQNLYPASVAAETARAASATADPGFIQNPVNIDSIKGFLIGRWATGANVNWAYDPGSDVNQIWPMNEDFSYTNTTLKTAAMANLPLGDLFHWWPAQYTTWKAQSNAEHATITNWLTNGTTSVKELPGIPNVFDLSQNYPNPFNPTTTIEYSITRTGQTSLEVYNILGEVIATLFNGIQQPGRYSATFDGGKFASGVYFYRLRAGNNVLTKKFVLMK